MPKGSYSEEIKHNALILREQGYTYSELSKILKHKIPKATLSNWFKNLILSDRAKERITSRIREGGSPGRAIAWQNTRKRREELLKIIRSQADNQIKDIDTLTAKICLAMLYLGEGAKTPEYIRFCNSDPKVIQLFLKLLRQAFIIDEMKLRGKVQCRADQNINELSIYWSNLSGISLTQFSKAWVDKRTINKPTKRLDYKGVFVVCYFSNKIFLELKFISDIIYKRLNLGL